MEKTNRKDRIIQKTRKIVFCYDKPAEKNWKNKDKLELEKNVSKLIKKRYGSKGKATVKQNAYP